MSTHSPHLWIVATPLGNLADISQRAKQTLADADIILAEDTRRAGRLLKEYGIKPGKLVSFFEHNEVDKQAEIMEAMRNGANVALITDAGTPLLADPGYRLCRACRQAGIPVSPVPGPSAPIAAISASGIPPLPFTFLGFLPRSAGDRRNLFVSFSNVPSSLIFFERKDRLEESLSIAYTVLHSRELAICREMTKIYEEFRIGRLESSAELCVNLAGELTVIIGPPEEVEKADREHVLQILQLELAKGLKLKEAARAVQRKCPGWTNTEIYNLGLSEKR